MAAEIKISIDDSGAGNGGPGGGGGGGNNGGGGGGGGDELTLIRLQRRYEKRLASTLEDQERTLIRVQRGAEKKLELQARQRDKGEQRGEKKVAADKLKVKREEDAKELTLIRVERAAERKLEQEKQKKLREERQKQRDDEAKELSLIRVQRNADAKLDAQAKQRERAEKAKQDKEEADKKLKANLRGLAIGAVEGRTLAAGINGGGVARTGLGGAGALAGGKVGNKLGGVRGAAAGAQYGAAAGAAVGGFIDNPFRGVGNRAISAANNDGAGLIGSAAEDAASALALIPGVGTAASLAVGVFGKAVTTAADVMGAFNERGRELSKYDGRIAAATANQDITRLMADIRESQRFGDGFARLINKQTEVEETFKGLLNPVKELALEYLPPVMDQLIDLIIRVLERLDSLVPGTDLLRDMANEAREARRRATSGQINDPSTSWLFGLGLSNSAMQPTGQLSPAMPARPAGVPFNTGIQQ